MPRATNGPARNKSRKRILRAARGYYGSRSKHRKLAKQQVIRSGVFAYRDRRTFKRDMRSLWITRITAACKMRGTRYSAFVNGLKNSGVLLNRKMLSQIAIEEPAAFDKLVEMANKATTATPAKAG
ncbi:MAG: 50S ribosomal protein L20 [Phycisphaerales bacterium]|nr:50S ribosomal protein L20 [Phycisphaerales bacterium]MCB9836426.1 50S ribosomal protein L20 [Phycisphaera sp.]